MNWYEYPVGNVFYTGNQYTGLDNSKVTDDFAHLVRNIGTKYALNLTYNANATELKVHNAIGKDRIIWLFDFADYSAQEIVKVEGNNRTVASKLYKGIRNEIKANRPALLLMEYIWRFQESQEYRHIGHFVVVTGYKKIVSSLNSIAPNKSMSYELCFLPIFI